MRGELIHAARRKSRHYESNRRVSRPRQGRVRTIKARNVVSELTLLVLPVNLNPEIGNSEWRSSWFSSVRHDTGKILNRPQYRLIHFPGNHSSLFDECLTVHRRWHEESKTKSMLHNGLLDLMNRSTELDAPKTYIHAPDQQPTITKVRSHTLRPSV